MASGVDDRQGEIIPLLSEVGLDREERLFNGIEVRGIGGKENEFAHGLIFDESLNLFRVVDIAVIKDEDASRARVGVSEGNDKFLEGIEGNNLQLLSWG